MRKGISAGRRGCERAAVLYGRSALSPLPGSFVTVTSDRRTPLMPHSTQIRYPVGVRLTSPGCSGNGARNLMTSGGFSIPSEAGCGAIWRPHRTHCSLMFPSAAMAGYRIDRVRQPGNVGKCLTPRYRMRFRKNASVRNAGADCVRRAAENKAATPAIGDPPPIKKTRVCDSQPGFDMIYNRQPQKRCRKPSLPAACNSKPV